MKKQIFILILIGIISQHAFGQISEGGTPVSFSLDVDVRDGKIPIISMPSVDVRALLQEDERDKDGGGIKPFRFGYSIDVDIDIKKDGLKETLSNGDNLWLLKNTFCRCYLYKLDIQLFQTCRRVKILCI